MFISKDSKEITWLWADGKRHTVSIELNGDKVDTKELYDTAIKLTQEKEDLCKNIGYLGLALTANPEAAWGFLLGWLVRSIKKDSNWNINHTDEVVPEDEYRVQMAEALESYAQMIREGKADKSVKSTPSIGSNDGTEYFG